MSSETSKKKFSCRKLFGNLLLLVGMVSILGAGGLQYYNQEQSNQGGTYSAQVVEQFQTLALPTEIPHNEGIYIDGALYLGILEIATLDLVLPVQLDWSYQNIKQSPCAYYGYLTDDNLVVGAHNYPSHFGRLDTLVLGDTLTITDPNGNLYEYEVVNISRLHQSENEKLLDRAPWDLTLYTCDNSNRTYRTVIRCQRL